MSLIASSGFAKPCVYNWSCFKLNNQSDQAARIICHKNNIGNFPVEAAGHSEGSTQFDISLNDGMGYPDPDQLNCEINFAGNEPNHSFSFYNPFWGPLIEFTLLSNNKMTVVAYDKWGSGQRRYDFNW
ncbi:hypothetical protein HRQ65_10435 [Tatlockia micdadei]|nr:hypothetical protein [Legionella micdadei]NSL18801.1 hypothetical protein [Legionella micdadei]